MWFIYALITTLAWGGADLFYKKGANEKDRYSHLKTSVIVGLIMGGHAIATLIISGVDYNPVNIIRYLPVSAMYILSMTVGYFGLRYLELSISSPIQNSSGALVCIMCLVFLGQSFIPEGMSGTSQGRMIGIITTVAVVLICGGVFFLGVTERKQIGKTEEKDRKYTIGFLAFLMPVFYCIIDALGTFFDAYYLDDFESTPLIGVTEDSLETVANVSYELTFLICAIFIIVFLLIKKEPIRIKEQKDRGIAAVLETAGQAAYVYAMSGNGAVAAPLVASYSIVSLVLSRIFLKEKLKPLQYVAVIVVLLGIAGLGLVEGLSE